jgi:hypothetical protein
MLLFRKVLKIGGTGLQPVQPNTVGGDARPTESFHNLRVGQKPMNDCPKKFLVAPASCRCGVQAGKPVPPKVVARDGRSTFFLFGGMGLLARQKNAILQGS